MEIARHTQIHLARHGKFAGMGRAAPPARGLPLTAAGAEQARRVGEFLTLRRPSCLYLAHAEIAARLASAA